VCEPRDEEKQRVIETRARAWERQAQGWPANGAAAKAISRGEEKRDWRDRRSPFRDVPSWVLGDQQGFNEHREGNVKEGQATDTRPDETGFFRTKKSIKLVVFRLVPQLAAQLPRE